MSSPEFYDTDSFRPGSTVRLGLHGGGGVQITGVLDGVSRFEGQWFVSLQTGVAESRAIRLTDVDSIEVGE